MDKEKNRIIAGSILDRIPSLLWPGTPRNASSPDLQEVDSEKERDIGSDNNQLGVPDIASLSMFSEFSEGNKRTPTPSEILEKLRESSKISTPDSAGSPSYTRSSTPLVSGWNNIATPSAQTRSLSGSKTLITRALDGNRESPVINSGRQGSPVTSSSRSPLLFLLSILRPSSAKNTPDSQHSNLTSNSTPTSANKTTNVEADKSSSPPKINGWIDNTQWNNSPTFGRQKDSKENKDSILEVSNTITSTSDSYRSPNQRRKDDANSIFSPTVTTSPDSSSNKDAHGLVTPSFGHKTSGHILANWRLKRSESTESMSSSESSATNTVPSQIRSISSSSVINSVSSTPLVSQRSVLARQRSISKNENGNIEYIRNFSEDYYLNVLIVDDQEISAKLIANNISQSERINKIVLSKSVRMALKEFGVTEYSVPVQIDKQNFDMVITDRNMPETDFKGYIREGSQDGEVLISALRKGGFIGNIIAISGQDENAISGKNAKDVMMNAGANIFFEKPVHYSDLLPIINTIIDQKKKQYSIEGEDSFIHDGHGHSR